MNIYVIFLNNGKYRTGMYSTIQEAAESVPNELFDHCMRYYPEIDKSIESLVADFARKTGWKRANN